MSNMAGTMKDADIKRKNPHDNKKRKINTESSTYIQSDFLQKSPERISNPSFNVQTPLRTSSSSQHKIISEECPHYEGGESIMDILTCEKMIKCLFHYTNKLLKQYEKSDK